MAKNFSLLITHSGIYQNQSIAVLSASTAAISIKFFQSDWFCSRLGTTPNIAHTIKFKITGFRI
jgi:hypothetical protein